MAVIATDDTHFVSVGGFGIGDGGEPVAHAESFSYDVEAATWSAAPALDRGRTQFALTQSPSGELRLTWAHVEHDSEALMAGARLLALVAGTGQQGVFR